jgi:histidyl-tRNA synthetase
MADATRPEPRLLKGFRDLFGDTLIRRRRMIDSILRVYARYGFAPLETPTLEYLDVVGKYLPDTDAPEGGVYAFRNPDDEWVALRYDFTAPLSRIVAQYNELPLPYRCYQIGPVFRNEKPGPGRFREFYQCDFDTVGTKSMAADAEVAMVLADALEELGIERGDYVIRVNSRRVTNGVLERIGIPVDENADDDTAPWLTAIRAIDKLDRVGAEGVADLLGQGRKDPSGDFTPGAKLEAGQIESIMRYIELPRGDRAGLVDFLAPLVAGSEVGERGLSELREIDALLTAGGYGDDRVTFDPSVVRGLAYYTGPVFEAELLFEITDEKGVTRQFGSVAGGGRYDNLVARFLGREVPGTGASIGIARLLAALETLDPASSRTDERSVLVTAMDLDQVPEYFRIAQELRDAGIAAEVYLGKKGIAGQIKYADRRGLPAVVIAGSDELAQGTVSIKDLDLGRELSKDVEDREEWRRERPAQVTVARSEMVSTLAEIVGRSNLS